MSSDRAESASVSFSEATKVEKLDSHTYRANLSGSFSIGAVPNGGYTGSCMLAAASAYLSSRGQRDTLTAHFEYPNRTTAGPAIVVIEDVKLTGQISTLHLTLWQGELLSQAPWVTPSSRRIVIAYTNHMNLRTFTGTSLPTGYEGTAAAELPSPMPDFEKLKTEGADEAWEEGKTPGSSKIVRSLLNWNFYLPRSGPLTPGVLDMWVRLASGERLTQAALPYIVDSFPYNLHTFLVAPELRKLLLDPPREEGAQAQAKEAREKDKQRASLWFPTVVMNIEAKTALPEEGVEWLAVRVTSKQIKEGKFDLDVMVRDSEGDIVALSHHVAMIVSIERNMGKKGTSAKPVL
ncbi:thioesterase family protein [Annulohypoxylon stygium]|nr:thioesterase family protein [Annulohypoxylon stygium]